MIEQSLYIKSFVAGTHHLWPHASVVSSADPIIYGLRMSVSGLKA